MFCLFFTTPADRSHAGNRRRRSRGQTVVTWFLALIWLALISFGVISITNPLWLQEWAIKGVRAESFAYRQYGDSFLHQGNYRLAIPQYQRSLEIDPERVGVMINLAVAYMYSGTPQQAAQVLETASRLESNLKDLIDFNLGELMERQGETDAAIQYYEKTIGSVYIAPDLANRKLGLLYLGSEQYEDALEAFENVLANQTDVSLPYMSMLWRCLDSFESDTVNLPIIEAQLSHGVTIEEMAPYDLKIIRELQQIDREIAKTHNHLGYIHVQRKDYSSASSQFLRSLEIWPGNTDGRNGMSFLAQLREDAPQSDTEN